MVHTACQLQNPPTVSHTHAHTLPHIYIFAYACVYSIFNGRQSQTEIEKTTLDFDFKS